MLPCHTAALEASRLAIAYGFRKFFVARPSHRCYILAVSRQILFLGASSLIFAACAGSGAPDGATSGGGSPTDAGTIAPDASSGTSIDSGAPSDASTASDSGSTGSDTLAANRDRLLETYFEFLKATATSPQTNGLSSSNVSNVCDVWTKLEPSARDVFLTITARMQGSKLGADESSMLSHVVKLYRVVGGDGETTSDPGSCGGGEANRMIMSMDATLHDTQVAANDNQGAKGSGGAYDIADAPSGTSWRNSQDVGGPHSPFDSSDETETGAPRGQTQYFRDPTSAAAKAPLGRQDLSTLVDPYALEMDQDYDCTHNSNPDCEYTFYGPLCAPESTEVATQIYVASYGDFVATWKPTGCP